ncbi:unnamed protein product [Paramecium primaurelia]|uniref:Uncharacterized protein n=1 Tax=Paramecium primaurelia TaxID=5886 RepID=A0A8S1LMK9_PARPR|nr:unnamed protein product [Paramecium primaurelia]
MNTITQQLEQYKPEIQQNICEIHKSDIVAIDLVISEKCQFQYLCYHCLVAKINDNNISTIEQTKERIQSYKTKKQENKSKEIQLRLDYFKKILDQIGDFKCSVENILDKIYTQINAQIVTIQKEKSSLLENYQLFYNFQDEVKSLSKFLSIDNQNKQLEFQLDSQLIHQIFQQFELLFNNASYFQTIDTFKDVKQKIELMNENIKFELMESKSQNSQKTTTLNRICQKHNKEILMIDIDTKNKKMEDRFVCVNCISDHPNCQYKTIEKVNEELNYVKNEQDRILKDFKTKKLEKYEKLQQQIAIMRKNQNQQLNEISDKLITEFSKQTNTTDEISIQLLRDEELESSINNLIQFDQKNININQIIEDIKSKDLIQEKEIESKLESLKQQDQLDIQESINILKDIQNENQFQGILQLSQYIQENTNINQENQTVQKEIHELIDTLKLNNCQRDLPNQISHQFQENLKKINNATNKIKSISDLNPLDFQKQVKDDNEIIENDQIYLKKFCDNQNIEQNLETLQIEYEKFQQACQIKIEKLNKIIDQLEKEMEQKIKMKEDEIQQLHQKMKEKSILQIEDQQQVQQQSQLIDENDYVVDFSQIEIEYEGIDFVGFYQQQFLIIDQLKL